MSVNRVGRYEIVSEVARGGMATVYLAQDPRFNRQVAVKILPRAFTHDPQFLGRFRQEAQAVASLEHQYVVPVYDFGEEDGQPYLVMRYMGGGSLSQQIRQGALSLPAALKVLRPIASALDYAHERGVVHRDIKPANILFDASGGAYLSDFGIAKLAQATANFTGSGAIGTPAYMSPEQIQGGAPIDGRTDIYSLAITLYEMLSGQVPYTGETTTQQMMQHILAPIPRIREAIPTVSPAIEAVLMKALAKSREDRFPTATAFVNALEDPHSVAVMASTQPLNAPRAAFQTTPAVVSSGSGQAFQPGTNGFPVSPETSPFAGQGSGPGALPDSAAQAPRQRKLPYLAIAGVALLLVLLVGGGAVLAVQSWGGAAGQEPNGTPFGLETPISGGKIDATLTTSDKRASTGTATPTTTPSVIASATLTPFPTHTATPTRVVTQAPTATAAPTHAATPTWAATQAPTATPPPTHAATPTWAATQAPTATAAPTHAATQAPTATSAAAGSLTLSHAVNAVWCVTQKTYRIRFSFYVSGGAGQHTIYRDIDSQVVYGPGGETPVVYELDWGASSSAVGVWYVRSGDQRVESKFYVNPPDCEDAPAP